MKKGKILLSFSAIVLLSVAGCQKYPDGPLVSARTKTERVANNWKVGQAFENGKDVTADYNRYELSLTKSGGADLSVKFVVIGATFEYTTNGTWSFVNSKEKLSFDYNNNDADGVYQILKLEEDEMWLKGDGGSLELHYVTR